MHQIPLKIFNNLPRNYDVIDVIISSKETSHLKIIYEEINATVPAMAKEKTLGYLKMLPANFDKVIFFNF